MREIALKSGHVILVDDSDFPAVSSHAWHLDKDGYPVSRFGGRKGRNVRLHRFLLATTADQIGDHINGNRLDCRRANLRIVDRVGNGQNVARHRDNKSGFKGVFLCKETKRWRSRLMAEGRVIELGRFASKEAAAFAYDEAAKRHHGEFARLNFPRGKA